MATNKSGNTHREQEGEQGERISAAEYRRITTEVGTGLLGIDYRVDAKGREFYLMRVLNVDSGTFCLFKIMVGEQGCTGTRQSSRTEAEQQSRRYLNASRECAAA